MAEQPGLPESTQRLHALRWKELIEKHGFTGGHLQWHLSPQKRREAAKPPFSLKPPPMFDNSKYIGTHGDRMEHGEWLQEKNQEWAERQKDPAVIDLIGIAETVSLAKERFLQVVPDYRAQWASETEGDADEFAQWLERLQRSVVSQVGDLWRPSEWHAAWFERIATGKLDTALAELVGTESRRARSLEIQHLENPDLPLSKIVSANGILKFAATNHRFNETMRRAKEVLERHQQVMRPTPLSAPVGLPTAPTGGTVRPTPVEAPATRPPEAPIDERSADAPQFPNRASWLSTKMVERGWNKHDVERCRGPHYKTVQKILDGQPVREEMLGKLVTALSGSPDSKNLAKVTLLDIPRN